MNQFYTFEQIQELKKEYQFSEKRFNELNNKLMDLWSILREETAIEYLIHGAFRRLKVLKRCLDNIYKIFPPERESLLKKDELTDLVINMHAFFINMFGLMDNLAWIWVHENKIETLINNRCKRRSNTVTV